MQTLADRDLAYAISPRALAKLLHPYRGLPKLHTVRIDYVNPDGSIVRTRINHFSLVAITDGKHTVTVALTHLYGLSRLLPGTVTASLTADALTLAYPQGRVILDHQTPSAAMEIPIVDLRSLV